ncbi:AP-2 complex subunit beta [Heterocephalus glaber]|uniref:AP complex subunit beta n=3 Tax=Boreoeutheria TaxID=1437010 RepID=G5B750_HETGA|nr:AP-2 complex subunit beta [Heterocephalus glaber]
MKKFKGEIFELKAELNNEKKEKRKEAVKKVIAAMTVGKDVSSLFPDVVNCMQTDNLELKKLVYLYLMNYAKSQPDMAIMAVNSFVKDCEDPNPLIRALAVRTMGCIRVDKITEYLCEPLRKCLKDEDPYVRKTAAVCVAKLHDINAHMAEDQGFLDSLRDLIADSNPMVVANAVAALSEISESHPNSNLLDLNPQNINKLLTALNECTEWGQIFILDCLSNYNPKDDREAQSICERVTPRLSHANSAVVLSAVKVLMKFLELLPKDSDYYNMLLKKLAPPLVTLLSGEPEVQYVALRNINLIVQKSICERVTPRLSHANSAVVLSAVKVLMKFLELLPKDSDYYNMLLKKLAPPLVTLLSGEPEVQYVALRNINLIVQKRPEILKQEIKVFFVKYNDPIYVKLEKLDIMIRLASQANIAQVLAELKEYATEVDVDFVRKAVRAIGRCAIKVEQSAERCVSTLLDLIQTKVNYVVQEAIVVIRDIFRKYPNKYESIIATLCENLDSLDEPDARAAMIWIVGEYAERIDNADELLESFLEGFHDESTQVQLTLLTAIVKLFLKKPSETQELVQQVLSLATQDSDNPDLRDRGYIYWRLLSTDPVTAKEVVLSEKPLISEETDLIEPTLLDELICHIGSLASVYHKSPNAFVEGSHGIHRKHLPIHHGSTDAGDSPVGTTTATNLEQPQVIPSQGDLLGDLLNLDLGPPVNVPQVSSMQMGAVDLLGGGLDSLLGSDLGGGIGGSPAVGQSFIPSSVPATFAPSPTPAVVSSGLNDLFELSTGIGMAPGGYVAPKAVWLPAVKAKGLEISGTFTHRQGHIYMEMNFTNKALQHMTDFAIQFNKNSFGVIPSTPLAIHTPLMPNQSIDVSLPLNTLGPVMKMEPLNNLQVAVKNNIDVFYFSCLIPLNVLFVEDGKMERQVFLATWKDIPNENELQFQIKECHLNADTVSSKLQNNNVYTIAKRNVEGQDMLYQSLKLTNGIWILAELRIQPGNPNYTLSLKCRAPEVSQYIYQVYDSILKN